MVGAGFDALTGIGGATVVLRGVTIPALIDDGGGDERDRTAPNLNTRSEAVIEIKSGAVVEAPRPGEYLRSGDGVRYRIRLVEFRGVFYRILCDKS